MSKELPYRRQKNAEEAYEAVKKVLESGLLDRLPSRSKIFYYDSPPSLEVRGKGHTVNLYFHSRGVEYTISLSFLLGPAYDKIERGLINELNKVI